jgi:hypothetical protein
MPMTDEVLEPHLDLLNQEYVHLAGLTPLAVWKS